jgi:hypothetical protein
MKRIYFGAAALLLGSSALAWAADKPADTNVKAVTIGAKAADLVKAADWAKESKQAVKPAALTADEEAILLAKKGAGDPDLDLAAKPGEIQAEPAMAEAGVGGPEEPLETASAADLTPRPATHNYPPCSPGPGDDNCIQLYEPGVRQQLASWTRPTGGLAGADETQMAAAGAGTEAGVGGPYEPLEESTELAMNGDGSIDGAMGEVSGDEALTTEDGVAGASADSSAYTGMGGPLEEVAPVQSTTDYPPCRPGPGDDRCIQLYERGVSG